MSRRAARRVRAVAAAAGLVLAAASCSGGGGASTKTTVLSEELGFDLQARAMARAWPETEVCINVESAPAGLRAALEALFDEVTYVAMVDGVPSIGWDACTLVTPGPVGSYRADVVGVDVWVLRGFLNGVGETHLFRWDGTAWVDTTAAETGVTVTTAVS